MVYQETGRITSIQIPGETGQISDLAVGHSAIEHFLSVVHQGVPTVGQIRALKPPIEDFIDPGAAAQKGAVHGQEHIADGLIIGIPFMEKHAGSVPMLSLPIEAMIHAWRIHDLDVSNRDNYTDHGLHVVERHEHAGKHLVREWDLIRFMVIHHSERIDDPDATEAIRDTPLRWREALAVLQDIDASWLTRPGADVPIKDIQLRTSTARTLKLPYIALVLLEEAKNQHTGDPYEDQIQAALDLKLLRPDPVQQII